MLTSLEDTLSGDGLGLSTEGDTLVGGAVLENQGGDGGGLGLIAGRRGDWRHGVDGDGGLGSRSTDLGRHFFGYDKSRRGGEE